MFDFRAPHLCRRLRVHLNLALQNPVVPNHNNQKNTLPHLSEANRYPVIKKRCAIRNINICYSVIIVQSIYYYMYKYHYSRAMIL